MKNYEKAILKKLSTRRNSKFLIRSAATLHKSIKDFIK